MPKEAPKPRKGYIRSQVLIPALSYQLQQHPQQPEVCVVALMTPEGPVTLTMHKDAVSQLGSALLVQAQAMEKQPG